MVRWRRELGGGDTARTASIAVRAVLFDWEIEKPEPEAKNEKNDPNAQKLTSG